MTILLDGGMGQELLARSKSPPHPLWSAKVLMDEPQIVQAVHEDYIDAGAEVLTLNTYSATPERLGRDADADLFEPLQTRAMDLAEAARDAKGRAVRIAGCLPPLMASYRPDVAPRDRQMAETYQRIAEIEAPRVDLFICETLSTIREARHATAAARATGKPVWLFLTLNDDETATLRGGEPLSEAVETLEGMADMIGLNCSTPEALTAGIAQLKPPFGLYANAFTGVGALEPGGTVHALMARSDIDPIAYADHADHWIAHGAALVGGCCETGPAHIAEIARRLGKETAHG